MSSYAYGRCMIEEDRFHVYEAGNTQGVTRNVVLETIQKLR